MKTRKVKSRRPHRKAPVADRPWSTKDINPDPAGGLAEALPITWALQKSYVLSMVWAWYSQIRLRPHVRIPIPRLFSYRDP